MQRRIIKINLMALILIILLIISAIVCGIIYVPKLVNRPKQNVEQQLDNNQIDENKEEKISVHTRDRDIEFTAKIHKGEAGYTIKYDKDLFKIENSNSTGAYYIASGYNNVSISIYKEHSDFDRAVTQLYETNYNMYNKPTSSNEVFECDAVEIRLNESTERAVRQHLKTDHMIEDKYLVKGKDDDFFVIRITCPTDYEREVFPIIEEMLKTFKIL